MFFLRLLYSSADSLDGITKNRKLKVKCRNAKIKMKIYECKYCKQQNKRNKNKKRFRSSRKGVRDHLREVHNIRGKSKEAGGKTMPSQLTSDTLIEDW